jgi:hypothetical protein
MEIAVTSQKLGFRREGKTEPLEILTSGYNLPAPPTYLGDLEEVAAGTGVRERLKLIVPLHVLDFHIVVRHLLTVSQTLSKTPG